MRERDGLAAEALEFLILTAARTGELIGATWGEIDLKAKVWTVPAGRMKAGREHRVPLAKRAVEILKALPRDNGRVFPLSNMAFLQLLKRMERSDITPHGFRSSFRDWAAETHKAERDVTEMALAHAVSTDRGPYRRGDLFEKRRKLMDDWAALRRRAGAGAAFTPQASVEIGRAYDHHQSSASGNAASAEADH
jgi:integrase